MKLLSAPAAQRVLLRPVSLSSSFLLKPSSSKSRASDDLQIGSHNLKTVQSSSVRICECQALQRQNKRSLLSKGCFRDVGSSKTSLNVTARGLVWSTGGGRNFHGSSPNGFTLSGKEGRGDFSAGSAYDGGMEGEEDDEEQSDDGAECDDGKMEPVVNDEGVWDVQTKIKRELKSGLYLVGTPIGNLEDITLRALRVLKSATCILAEDTRHSAKLLRHYGIHTPTMSYHKFNEYSRKGELIQRLQRGEVFALISDAGMPSISDPGSELVKACVEANVQVFPIPGPCAALSALVASGLPTDEFSFVGFLSVQAGSRQKRLIAAAKESATQIFYVPPHKLCRVLDDFISAFGSSRRCTVAREITKMHEEFWRGTLEEAKVEFEERHPRGELTLIVEGLPERAAGHQATEEELKSRLHVLLDAGKSPSEATKLVAEEASARRNTVYSLALEISRSHKPLELLLPADLHSSGQGEMK